MPRPRFATAQSMLVVGLGALVAIGLGELLLRAFWPQRSSVTIGMFEQDPFAGYRLRADYRSFVRVPEYTTDIWTDGEGYRISRHERPAGEGATRLLVLGDSFTFGVGVDAEDAFPEVLERRLRGAGRGAWSVRNGGVGGYGPLRSSRLLLSSQGAWDPDVVVHALYVGNDLEDPNPEGYLLEPRIEQGRMVSYGHSTAMRLRLFLRTRSHLYAFLRARLYGLYAGSRLATRSQYLDPVGLARWTPWIERVSWPAGQEALRETVDWCRERGTRYLAVIVPVRYQVEEDAWRRYRESWARPEEDFDRDHAQRELTAFFREIGVPVVDLLPAFRERTANGESFYYRFDRHWNANGHRLAAEVIHERIEALGWTDSRRSARRDVVRAAGAPEL